MLRSLSTSRRLPAPGAKASPWQRRFCRGSRHRIRNSFTKGNYAILSCLWSFSRRAILPEVRCPRDCSGGNWIRRGACRHRRGEGKCRRRALLLGRCTHRDHLPGDSALQPESANQVPCLPIHLVQPGLDACVVRHDPAAHVSAVWTLPCAQPVKPAALGRRPIALAGPDVEGVSGPRSLVAGDRRRRAPTGGKMTGGFQIQVKEKCFMIKVFSVALLTAASLAGQAAPICSAVTVDDARALIGPTAKRTNDPSGCVWRGADGKKRKKMGKGGLFGAFGSYRAHSVKDGKTQTENGLGGTGFSSIPTDGRGSRAAIYLMKGP